MILVIMMILIINYDYDGLESRLVINILGTMMTIVMMRTMLIFHLKHIFVAFEEEFEGAVGPKVVVKHLQHHDADADADDNDQYFDQGDNPFSILWMNEYQGFGHWSNGRIFPQEEC